MGVLLITVIVLLHLQLSHKGWLRGSTYRSLKSWLVILLTIYALTNVLRYFLLLQNTSYFLPFLLLGVMIHSLIIYLISFYYVERALFISEDTKLVKKVLLYSFSMFVAVYIAIWVYDISKYSGL